LSTALPIHHQKAQGLVCAVMGGQANGSAAARAEKCVLSKSAPPSHMASKHRLEKFMLRLNTDTVFWRKRGVKQFLVMPRSAPVTLEHLFKGKTEMKLDLRRHF